MWFLVLLAPLVYFIWRYYRESLVYWKERGIDGPPPRLFLGNLWELTDRAKPYGTVLREWTKRYGKVYGIQEGVRKTLVVSDVAMLQELFVKKFDDFYGRRIAQTPVNNEDPRITLFQAQGIRWKRLRTICASAFSSNSLKKLKDTVEDSAIELSRLLEPHLDSDPIDLHIYFQEFTMDVISRITMGQDGSKMFQNPMSSQAIQIFQRSMRNPFSVLSNCVPGIRPILIFFFRLMTNVQRAAIKPMFQAIYRTVDERIAQRERNEREGVESEENCDFVDLMLDAMVEEQKGIDGNGEFSKNNVKISRVLTREEIVAQCFLFILAGFDTTSNALSYASWLLAKNPEKQRKLQKEIDEICGNDQTISYETLNRLKYTEYVIKEALRMFPLASIAASRSAMKDTSLGGIPIEKGTSVNADVWSLHFDKEIWGEDADEFVPERWEDEKTRHNSAFLPFGAGPRICIGMRLAYMEAKLALVHILRRFDFNEGQKTEKELKLFGSTTVAPESVTIYMSRRRQ